METKDEEVLNDDVSNESNGNESRRRSYPVRELKYIIEFVDRIYKELGPNTFHSKDDIARIHNLSSDYIKQPLSTCQQYKLLDLKHGTGYKVSDLFIRISKPLSEEEKINSIIESIRSIEIFNALIPAYEGHPLPLISGITNKIHRDFQLREAIAQKVADIFIKNLTDYNLLDSKGTLVLKKSKPNEVVTPPSSGENPRVDKDSISIPIPLKGANKRMAFLHIPEDYSDQDLKRISKFVKALRDEDDDDRDGK